MGVVQTVVRSTTCNQCGTSATFEFNERTGVQQEVIGANPWLKTGRLVNTTDGRILFYCTDKCEAEAIATGAHNQPEAKKIIDTTPNAAAVQVAAAVAKQREDADKALRAGGKVVIS